MRILLPQLTLGAIITNAIGFADDIFKWRNFLGETKSLTLYHHESTFYLKAYDGLLHPIPDKETIAEIGILTSAATNLSLEDHQGLGKNHSRYALGDPLPSLKLVERGSYDDIMRVFIGKILIRQCPLEVLADIPLGPMINPALLPWHNRLVIIAGPIVNGSTYRRFKTISIGFAVLNNQTLQVDRTESRRLFKYAFNLMDGEALAPNAQARWSMNIEDAHLTYGTGTKPYRLCSTKVALQVEKAADTSNSEGIPANNLCNNSTLLLEQQLCFDSGSVAAGKQKNWSPFWHNNSLYHIYSIQPWRIVEVIDHTTSANVAAGEDKLPADRMQPSNDSYGSPTSTIAAPIRTIALDTNTNTSTLLREMGWHAKLFGEPRGGTPAVLLPGGLHYFSLFHTRIIVKGNVNHSYMMGALVFCARPPFSLYAVSNVPIVDGKWYEGSWASRQLDYVVYPMSVLIQDGTGNDTQKHQKHHRRHSSRPHAHAQHFAHAHTHAQAPSHHGAGAGAIFSNKVLIISMGRQDQFGYIVKLDLLDVLGGMRLVNSTTC
jgi:hypothetical protein